LQLYLHFENDKDNDCDYMYIEIWITREPIPWKKNYPITSRSGKKAARFDIDRSHIKDSGYKASEWWKDVCGIQESWCE